MNRRIKISNLKSVSTLDFELPAGGVWLLTGENGSGKTTLLACLHRLGDKNAFPKHFQTSNISDRLDNYTNGKISFSIGNSEVVYRYSGTRWAPKPKKNTSILKNFGYGSVIFVGANAERVTPKPEDFSTDRIHSVPQTLKDAANEIFNTQKFNSLRRVNVTRGQNQAFVFKDGNSYYSEKNFSLGELCTLKLIGKLQSAPPNSLIVIDELEMALHPSAQVRLYHYLVRVAKDHDHTVIFSTHSVSLIKTAERHSILYLQKQGQETYALKKPYLSTVLGGLAFVEEKSADTVIYVEDEMAEHCTRAFLTLVLSHRLQHEDGNPPKVEVVPIGGFSQVVDFLKRHDALHRASVKSFALLDEDVKSETVAGWQKSNNHQKLAWFDEYSARIRYLPWTPESGLVRYLAPSENDLLSLLRRFLEQPQLQFPAEKPIPPDTAGRQTCKQWVKDALDFWNVHFGIDHADAKEAICNCIAKKYFTDRRADTLQLFGPMIA